MQTYTEFWEPVQKVLQREIPETTYGLWFEQLELVGFDGESAVILASTDVKANIIRKRYMDVIGKSFETALGFPISHMTIIAANKDDTSDEHIASLLNGGADGAEQKNSAPAVGEEKANGETGTGTDTVTYAPWTGNTDTVVTAKEGTADVTVTEKHDSSVRTEKTEKTDNRESRETAENTEGGDTAENNGCIGDIILDRELTFESFIVGASNRFAQAACIAVSNTFARGGNPLTSYNPLFIWGPSGLGKTHLLHAVTNRVKEHNPRARIVMVKAETFTTELIASIQNNSRQEFQNKYRLADILLIDDIQFISGKEATQEEFFNTFNALYDSHHHIVLTSDRPPKEIRPLEDRLRSRFEWGLIADIQPPDMELRVAIASKKAELLGVEIPNEVLRYLGENIKSNIRQIEGAINKLKATSELTQCPITMDMARSIAAVISTNSEPVSVTQDKILAVVSKKYGVTADDIRGPKRSRDIAYARHVSAYLLREITGTSYPDIGKLLNRDHSTAMASYTFIKDRIKNDVRIETEMEELRETVKNA